MKGDADRPLQFAWKERFHAKPYAFEPNQVEQQWAAIIEWLSNGGSLLQYSMTVQGAADHRDINRYANDERYPERAKEFYDAYHAGSDSLLDEAIDIIDTEPERVTVTIGENITKTTIDSASVTWLKNRADMRLRAIVKRSPKKYADKLDLTAKISNYDAAVAELLAQKEAPQS